MRHKALSECYTIVSVRSQHFLRNSSHACRYSTSIKDAKPFKSIPGLSALPFLGPLHHFLPVIGLYAQVLCLPRRQAQTTDFEESACGQFGPKANVFSLFEILHKKYGPVVKIPGVFGRVDTVMLFDPEDIDQVYRSQESNPLRHAFETMEYYREVVRKDTYDDGIYGLITAHGPKWRDFRTKVNPALLKLKLVRVYMTPLEEIAQDFVNRLKLLNQDEIYMRDHFLSEVDKWSLESLALVGLGARLGCLKDELTPDHPASKLMNCAKDILQSSLHLDFLPIPWKYIPTPAYKKLVKTLDSQWEISTMYIEQARKRINERGHDIPEEDKSIIEKLLAIDERVAIMMANEMLLAGIDTVAFTVTSVLYYLAKNPEKQEKLRQELRSSEHQTRYLKACLKETLRIWHVVPANLRRTDKDHIVRGYHIPPGIDVVVPNEYLSRMEKYYPQANDFIPERWLADKADPLYYGNAHPMVTLPFGYGIRSCIGRRIAELEIEILIKKLIQEFNVTWEGPPIKIVNKMTNTFEKPFFFKFDAVD